MEYILTMSFLCTNNSKTSLTVNGIKPGLTQAEITALMDLIISKNIFSTSKGELIQKSGASITERTVTAFEY